MTQPLPPPTQSRYPWRAVARTVAAAALALLPALPAIAQAAGVATIPLVVAVLTLAATVTRILAIPAVDDTLRRLAPWLATTPSRPGRRS